MKKLLLTLTLFLAGFLMTRDTNAQMIISGYMANPGGTDAPYEYVQLIATDTIDFSATPYSVVFCNNGTANSNGWVAGGNLSYGFNITTGTVVPGQVCFVGGSGMLISGSGSTSIPDGWLRTINTGTTAGDGFGSANASGSLGNGGTSADGIAVFAGLTSSLTSTSVPVDAVMFGTAVGSAKPATGGYTMPANDRYTSTGVFGDVGNSYLYPEPVNNGFTRLEGEYDPFSNTWVTPRTGTNVVLTLTATYAHIEPSCTFVIPGGIYTVLPVIGKWRLGGDVLVTSLFIEVSLPLMNTWVALGNFNLTLAATASGFGNPGSRAYVLTNGTGEFRRGIISNGAYLLPVGDTSGVREYSPVTVTFTGGTFLPTNYITARAINQKHPNNTSTTDYLNRYWEVTAANIVAPVYDISLQYLDADIVGSEANIWGGKWDGVSWTLLNQADAGTNTISGTGLNSFSAFTGGEQSVMPVELASFVAFTSGNSVTLNWATEMEINNDKFEIERKIEADNNWVAAGTVDGSGNSNERKNYSFTDKNLAKGNYNYRLKQVDYNGNYEYFNLSGLVSVGAPEKFALNQNYPNPFNPVTNISFELPFDSQVSLTVYDMSGKEVARLVNEFRPAGFYDVSFNAMNLASGIYFYKLFANGQQMIKKMTVIK